MAAQKLKGSKEKIASKLRLQPFSGPPLTFDCSSVVAVFQMKSWINSIGKWYSHDINVPKLESWRHRTNYLGARVRGVRFLWERGSHLLGERGNVFNPSDACFLSCE